MVLAKIPLLSERDYLDAEPDSPVRHEYVAGQVYAMAGASKAHGTLALNVASALHNHLRGRSCRPFIGNMKVHLAEGPA
jgi:Uma2 family endonuclease